MVSLNKFFFFNTSSPPSYLPFRSQSSNLRDGKRTTSTVSSLALIYCSVLTATTPTIARAFSTTTTTTTMAGQPPSTRYDYEPPSWAKGKFTKLPDAGRLHLANLPTPLYPIDTSTLRPRGKTAKSVLQRLIDLDISLYLKRDDMTGGCETGGNKIRKLEFLLADALAQGASSVVTIGGEQSNHCRATAAACRMVGLDPHLILRTRRADDIQRASSSTSDDENQNAAGGIGCTGNILFDRMVGSTIYTCTPGEYGRLGSKEFVDRVCAHLEQGNENETAYPIPVGGSNGVGTWGYLEAVEEILTQWDSISDGADATTTSTSLDHIVFACGSGGTAAGIALGIGLAYSDVTNTVATPVPKVHAIGVCDFPDYFYNHVAEIADEMGLDLQSSPTTEEFIRQHMIAHQGKGLGYASSTPEELDFITNFALETGVVLDPVYSGKALYHFLANVLEGDDAETYRDTNIIFWHTGGALGMFDKANDLIGTMAAIAPTKRLDLYGKDLENGVDISTAITEKS